MDIASGQKFTLARLQPPIASVRLTLGAVPVSAGIERDDTMAAADTLVEMAAERCCAAALDRGQHFQVKPVQPGTIPFDEVPARAANQIGHLQRWPVHLLVVLREKGG
jgi:hypothetical protein